MSELACQSPLEWLAHLERLCLEHAHSLPQQEQNDEEWLGIGFRLGSALLVAPLAEVSEILTPPSSVSRAAHQALGMWHRQRSRQSYADNGFARVSA